MHVLFLFLWLLSPSNAYNVQVSFTSSSTILTWTKPVIVPLSGMTTDRSIAVADFNGVIYLAFKQEAGSNIFLVSTTNIDNNIWTPPMYLMGTLTGFGPALYIFQQRLWMSFTDSTGVVYVTSSATPSDSQSWTPIVSLTALTGLMYFENSPSFDNIGDSILIVRGSMKNAGGWMGYVVYDASQSTWDKTVYYGSEASHKQWNSVWFQGRKYTVFLGTGNSNFYYMVSDSIGGILFPDRSRWKLIQTTSDSIPIIEWHNTLLVAYKGSTLCVFQQSSDGVTWNNWSYLNNGQLCYTAPSLLINNQKLYYFAPSP